MSSSASPLLTRKEAFRYLRLGEATFGRLVRSGAIEAIRMGGVVRFSKRGLDDYITRCTTGSKGSEWER